MTNLSCFLGTPLDQGQFHISLSGRYRSQIVQQGSTIQQSQFELSRQQCYRHGYNSSTWRESVLSCKGPFVIAVLQSATGTATAESVSECFTPFPLAPIDIKDLIFKNKNLSIYGLQRPQFASSRRPLCM